MDPAEPHPPNINFRPDGETPYNWIQNRIQDDSKDPLQHAANRGIEGPTVPVEAVEVREKLRRFAARVSLGSSTGEQLYRVVVKNEDSRVLLDKTFDNQKEFEEFSNCLHTAKVINPVLASLIPVRVRKIKDLAEDFFLPTTINQASRVESLPLRGLVSAVTFIWDIATLPLRCLTVIPRIVGEALVHRKQHALLTAIKEKGDPESLEAVKNLQHVRVEVTAWKEQSQEAYKGYGWKTPIREVAAVWNLNFGWTPAYDHANDVYIHEKNVEPSQKTQEEIQEDQERNQRELEKLRREINESRAEFDEEGQETMVALESARDHLGLLPEYTEADLKKRYDAIAPMAVRSSELFKKLTEDYELLLNQIKNKSSFGA